MVCLSCNVVSIVLAEHLNDSRLLKYLFSSINHIKPYIILLKDLYLTGGGKHNTVIVIR